MLEIVSLFTCFNPLLSAPTIAQFSRIGCTLLAMTGRVTMLNISRWTSKGGSYPTIQRFFNTVVPWGMVCALFFKTHLLDRDGEYLIAADQTTVSKSGKQTHGLNRFFASVFGKTIPGVAFLAISLLSVKQRRSYPMSMAQIVRDTASEAIPPPKKHPNDSCPAPPKRKRGRLSGKPQPGQNRCGSHR